MSFHPIRAGDQVFYGRLVYDTAVMTPRNTWVTATVLRHPPRGYYYDIEYHVGDKRYTITTNRRALRTPDEHTKLTLTQ